MYFTQSFVDRPQTRCKKPWGKKPPPSTLAYLLHSYRIIYTNELGNLFMPLLLLQELQLRNPIAFIADSMLPSSTCAAKMIQPQQLLKSLAAMGL